MDRAFEIGGFLFSPVAGTLLQPVGRKNSIIIGFIILVRLKNVN
jgi:MFS family permease